MLTTKEKQYKMIKALGLDVGNAIVMKYGSKCYNLIICESANEERYFLEALDPDMYNFPISYLISREWTLIDVANMYPQFTMYFSRSQGKQKIMNEFIVAGWNKFKEGYLSNYTGLQRRVNYSSIIDSVYYNTDKKTTVVNWSNGEITKVKCAPEDKFDLENGIMAAIAKYHCDNRSKTLRNTIARAAKKAKNTTKESTTNNENQSNN